MLIMTEGQHIPTHFSRLKIMKDVIHSEERAVNLTVSLFKRPFDAQLAISLPPQQIQGYSRKY
jgi:hypothetical protein